MATNETNTTDKPYDYNVSLAYYIYVFQGIFILICNTLLIISIFKFKELGVKKVKHSSIFVLPFNTIAQNKLEYYCVSIQSFLTNNNYYYFR